MIWLLGTNLHHAYVFLYKRSCTLGARDISCTVFGLGQVCLSFVSSAVSGLCLRSIRSIPPRARKLLVPRVVGLMNQTLRVRAKVPDYHVSLHNSSHSILVSSRLYIAQIS